MDKISAQSKNIDLDKSITNQNAESLEDRRLNYYSLQSNQELMEERKQKTFFQMSLIEIFNKLSSTLITILTELTDIIQTSKMENKFPTVKEVVDIFVQDDRLIYIGITLIFLTMTMYFIDLTS